MELHGRRWWEKNESIVTVHALARQALSGLFLYHTNNWIGSQRPLNDEGSDRRWKCFAKLLTSFWGLTHKAPIQSLCTQRVGSLGHLAWTICLRSLFALIFCVFTLLFMRYFALLQLENSQCGQISPSSTFQRQIMISCGVKRFSSNNNVKRGRQLKPREKFSSFRSHNFVALRRMEIN